jgi:hypothetical protein
MVHQRVVQLAIFFCTVTAKKLKAILIETRRRLLVSKVICPGCHILPIEESCVNIKNFFGKHTHGSQDCFEFGLISCCYNAVCTGPLFSERNIVNVWTIIKNQPLFALNSFYETLDEYSQQSRWCYWWLFGMALSSVGDKLRRTTLIPALHPQNSNPSASSKLWILILQPPLSTIKHFISSYLHIL